MKAIDLSNYVINYYILKDKPLLHTDMHKILYEINGAYLQKTGHFLLDENFEAWSFGPCIHEVYKAREHSPILMEQQKDEPLMGHVDRSGNVLGNEEVDFIAQKTAECLSRIEDHAGILSNEEGWIETLENKGVRGTIEDDLVKRDYIGV
ncbi:type II toxin-antitoxin system antitoxin SocA domain-containing protein [Campylobacter sp. MOP51]|uniref:type II toxin-antitoxin system antitoxin SocA domain-containing protein n=1 Tax=Campylobacter canis TaxID=3378588 RepID=UPI003C6B6685